MISTTEWGCGDKNGGVGAEAGGGKKQMSWTNIFPKYDKSGDIFADALVGVLGTCGTCFILAGNNTLADK